MNREHIVSAAITEDEMKDLTLRLRTIEDETGRRLTTSNFLREFVIKPYLNGNSSPPQETQIETIPKEPWDEL